VIKNAPTEFFEMATPDGKGAINYAMRRPSVWSLTSARGTCRCC
jgi:aminomuconate-semialdehyde/2-hydroxymuconate-6-semialdehyde dehydrogenase